MGPGGGADGQRGLTSELDRGEFYCPQCRREGRYTLSQARSWFTLYFIPLFPIGGSERFVECHTCGGKFVEDVLEMEPPSEGQQTIDQVVQFLEEGASFLQKPFTPRVLARKLHKIMSEGRTEENGQFAAAVAAETAGEAQLAGSL